MMAIQRDTQPKYWFNEHYNPPIDIWLFAFPAYVFPVLVAAVFIWTRPHRRFVNRLNGNYDHLGRGLRARVRNDRQGDFSGQLQFLLSLFHAFCTGRALSQNTDFYKDDLSGHGSAEALSLLVGGFYLNLDMLPSYLATSAGWMLLAINKRFFAAAGLLALPCAWQLLGRTGLAHWQSGILLFIIALEFAEPGLDSGLVTYCISNSVMAIYLPCLLIGGAFALLRMASQQGTLQEAIDTIRSELYEFYDEAIRVFVRMGAFLAPLVINAVFTGFLGSCIGWRWILAGQPANSPFASFLGAKLLALCYPTLWIVVRFFYKLREPDLHEPIIDTFWREMPVSADATGLAAVIMVALWLTAIVLPHLHVII